MAITATLVYTGNNRLRYLVAATAGGGETLLLTNATMLANAVKGPLTNILNAPTAGYGKLAAGALTQAQARALLLSLSAAAVVGVDVPTAIARFTSRSGDGIQVDANVDGGGAPELSIVARAICTGYLDIEIQNAIGTGTR
jgi:hypothetical protein